jgi:sortase A
LTPWIQQLEELGASPERRDDQAAFAAEHTYRTRTRSLSLMKTTWMGRGLWIVGATLITSYGAMRVHADAARREGIQQFSQARASLSSVSNEPARAPDQSGWSENRIRAYANGSAAQTEVVPQALLHIPSVKLTVPIYADTSDSTLNWGAGLIAGTASPGAAGNTGIAAHRDSFFRGLKDVALGDRIEIEHYSGTRAYRVSALYIVSPDDMRPLEQTQHPVVTLVTCYPFYYVGSAPQRYIVRAVAVAP